MGFQYGENLVCDRMGFTGRPKNFDVILIVFIAVIIVIVVGDVTAIVLIDFVIVIFYMTTFVVTLFCQMC